MHAVNLILYVVAALAFLAAACATPARRPGLIAIGLLAFTLVYVVASARAVH